MQLLQVRRKVREALCVEELCEMASGWQASMGGRVTHLADHVARLHRPDRLEVAAHRTFVVALRVEVIAVSTDIPA